MPRRETRGLSRLRREAPALRSRIIVRGGSNGGSLATCRRRDCSAPRRRESRSGGSGAGRGDGRQRPDRQHIAAAERWRFVTSALGPFPVFPSLSMPPYSSALKRRSERPSAMEGKSHASVHQPYRGRSSGAGDGHIGRCVQRGGSWEPARALCPPSPPRSPERVVLAHRPVAGHRQERLRLLDQLDRRRRQDHRQLWMRTMIRPRRAT